MGRLDRSEALLLRALQMKRDLRNSADIADALANLAIVTAQQKMPDYALRYAREGITIALGLQSKALIIKTLEAFVTIFAGEQDYQGAARLIGLTESLRAQTGILVNQELTNVVPIVRAGLSPEEFRHLTAEGAATSIEDAVGALA